MELVDLLQVAEEDVFLTHQLWRDDVLHGATLHLLHVALQQDEASRVFTNRLGGVGGGGG